MCLLARSPQGFPDWSGSRSFGITAVSSPRKAGDPVASEYWIPRFRGGMTAETDCATDEIVSTKYDYYGMTIFWGTKSMKQPSCEYLSENIFFGRNTACFQAENSLFPPEQGIRFKALKLQAKNIKNCICKA